MIDLFVDGFLADFDLVEGAGRSSLGDIDARI